MNSYCANLENLYVLYDIWSTAFMADFPLKPIDRGAQPVEPSRPISDKRRENNTPRPRLPPQREEKAPEDGHQIDEFV